jgi:hypothetical protein
MKKPLILLLLLLLILTETNAQKFEIEYDSVGTKVAIKDLQNGKLITGFLYDDVEINDNIGIITMGKKYGLFDINFANIYCCDYEQIGNFDSLYYSGHKGIVKKKGKEGLVGLSKDKGMLEIILPFKYSSIETACEAGYLYFLRKGNKFGIYNIKTRKEALPFWVKNQSYIGIQGNYIVVQKKDKYGLYSSDGKELLPLKYSSIDILCTGSDVFQVYEGEKSGFYDARIEKLLVEPIEGYLELSEIDNRFYSLYYQEIQTYIDSHTGKPLLALDYNFTGILSKKRYMSVEYKGKNGIYDFKELKLVVPCTYIDLDELQKKEAQYFD